MRYLYIDNVRGFADTYVPIKDVNFLVGENSTGKTSFLEIIRLLSYPGFWIVQDFDVDGSRLNHFQNIVSLDSQNRSYFRIGVIEYPDIESAERPKENMNVFLMTFTDKGGMPEISEYNCIRYNNEIELILREKAIFYKFNPMDRVMTSSEILEILKNWVSQGLQKHKGYKGYKRMAVPVVPFLRISHTLNLLEVESLGRKEPRDEQIRGIKLVEILAPKFAANIDWLGPIRSEPKRTYDAYNVNITPQGDHVPYALREMLNRKVSKKKRTQSKDILLSMEGFGKESGLYDSITIKEFGKTPISPFGVDVTMGSKSLSIKDVGYGVPQSLPVIFELLARAKATCYAIQQPEIHLHPKAQVALGELIYDMAVNEQKRFFVETHSDYIIDRFRLGCGKNSDKNINLSAQVLFFERTTAGNRIHAIEIEKNGQYSEDQPKTFREFFVKEALSLLEI